MTNSLQQPDQATTYIIIESYIMQSTTNPVHDPIIVLSSYRALLFTGVGGSTSIVYEGIPEAPGSGIVVTIGGGIRAAFLGVAAGVVSA
jgi:hypothetical protein